MSYENLERSLKALTLTVPAARAFGMTVKFALNQGRDPAIVFRLEDHFRDRKVMKNCIERMRQDPLARKCIEDRYLGPELDLDALVQYPRGSLGYTYAKVLKRLGYNAHFYTDRKSLDAETDYVTMRVRPTSTRSSTRSISCWTAGSTSRPTIPPAAPTRRSASGGTSWPSSPRACTT